MLSKSQINKAAKANKALGIARAEWQLHQLKLSPSLDPDGVPGPITSRAVAVYQCLNGLPQTGIVDGPTLESLQALQTPWGVLKSVGVWNDRPSGWCVRNADEIGEYLQDHGIDHVQLQLNSSGDRAWKPDWTEFQVHEFSSAMRDYGVSTGLMPWAITRKTWIDGFGEDIRKLVKACVGGCHEIDPDIEGPWTFRELKGYETTHHAADALDAHITRATIDSFAIRSATTFAAAIKDEKSSRAYAIKKLGDRHAAQIYYSRGECNGDIFHEKGPRRRPHLDLREFVELGFRPEDITAGVPGWSLSGFNCGLSPEVIFLMGVESCIWRGMRNIRIWSLKHLLNSWYSSSKNAKTKTDYMSRTLLRLKYNIEETRHEFAC